MKIEIRQPNVDGDRALAVHGKDFTMGSGTRHCLNWRVLIMPRLTAEFFTDDAVDTPYWWEAAKPSPISANEVTRPGGSG
jgi:hypothetical protein